jgi:hypothetical protein
MDIEKYIGYYKNVIPNDVCKNIMDFNLNFQPSTYSNNKGKTGNSDERVRMDECWVKSDSNLYGDIKITFEYVCHRYSKDIFISP